MRDLKADLEICNRATPGPWNGEENSGVEPVFETGCGCCTASHLSKEDAEFIASAREGWPHAIERAIKAEAEVERYKLMVKSITGGLDEAIETVHYLEAENAQLRKVADLVNTMQESESGYSARLAEIEMLKTLADYEAWKEGQDG